ncbi:MAG: flagellar hook-length control protein FliK [Planctomycetes bacterium]|nr:flagellar hook-length control protein FliK [Planctomycetota bacterium]
MQVSLLSLVAAGTSAGPAPAALLPILQNLTEVGPQTRALRTARQEAEQSEERQRRSEHDRTQTVTALAANGPTDVLRAAERQMAPGSWTRQRLQIEANEQRHATQNRQAFRNQLTHATGEKSADTTRNTGGRADAAREATSAARPGDGDTTTSGKPGGVSTEARSASPPTLLQAARDIGIPVANNTVAGMRSAGSAVRSTAGGDAGRVAGLATARVQAAGSVTRSAGAGGDRVGAQGGRPATGGGKAPSTSPLAAGVGRGSTPHTRAASASSAANTQASATAEKAEDANIERILRVVRSQIGKEHSRATLRLDPPELGTIRLHMDLRKDALSLRIDTQTQMAQRLLSEQLDGLRQGLASSGIQLERVEIRPPVTIPHPGGHDVPQEQDAPPEQRDGTGEADAGPAGGGGHEGADSASAEPDGAWLDGRCAEALTSTEGVRPGPAAESLVNVLA